MFTKTHLVLMALALAGAVAMHLFAGEMRWYRTAALIAVAIAFEASGHRHGARKPYGGMAAQRAVTWALGLTFVGMLTYALREIFADGRGLVITREALRLALAGAGLYFCFRISRRLRFARRTV